MGSSVIDAAAKRKKLPSRQREYRQLIARIEALEDALQYLQSYANELERQIVAMVLRRKPT